MRVCVQQLKFIDENLRAIAGEIEDNFRMEFEITSLYRIDDSGVHGTLPLRGIDLGCHNEEIGNVVCEYVNSRWIYDPERPDMRCAIHHNSGTGFHIHLQTHPRTIRRRYYDSHIPQ